MKRTILLFCVLSVLAWAAGTVLAQGKDKGVARPANPNKTDANVPAVAKKAPAPQNMEKAAKEKGKGGMDQAQTRGKSAKDQATDKMAAAKGKGRDQQMQQATAQHMKRQAQLTRIRELAVKKGDTKMVEQVDQLIAKENQLYQTKLQKTQGRMGGAMPPAGAPQPGPGKGKAEKPAGPAAKPPETKPQAQTPPAAGGQPAPAPAPATPPTAAPATPPAPAPAKPPEPNAPKP